MATKIFTGSVDASLLRREIAHEGEGFGEGLYAWGCVVQRGPRGGIYRVMGGP